MASFEFLWGTSKTKSRLILQFKKIIKWEQGLDVFEELFVFNSQIFVKGHKQSITIFSPVIAIDCSK